MQLCSISDEIFTIKLLGVCQSAFWYPATLIAGPKGSLAGQTNFSPPPGEKYFPPEGAHAGGQARARGVRATPSWRLQRKRDFCLARYIPWIQFSSLFEMSK